MSKSRLFIMGARGRAEAAWTERTSHLTDGSPLVILILTIQFRLRRDLRMPREKKESKTHEKKESSKTEKKEQMKDHKGTKKC